MSFIRSVLVLGIVGVLAACGQGAQDKAAPVVESETTAPAVAEAPGGKPEGGEAGKPEAPAQAPAGTQPDKPS